MASTNDDNEDGLDLCAKLRLVAARLPDQEQARRHFVSQGLQLGLPQHWLDQYPTSGALPVDYTAPDYGTDAALTWKAQEFLARSGRLAVCDPALVAEALETACADDGSRAFDLGLSEIMFILTWPKRTYGLHTELVFRCDVFLGLLTSSSSVHLGADLDSCWKSAHYRLWMLDGALDVSEDNPWTSLAGVLSDAADRIEEGSLMELRRVQGLDLPEAYRSFLR